MESPLPRRPCSIVTGPSGLENEALAVRRPIRFRVLTAMRELVQVVEVLRLSGEEQRASEEQRKEFHHLVQLY